MKKSFVIFVLSLFAFLSFSCNAEAAGKAQWVKLGTTTNGAEISIAIIQNTPYYVRVVEKYNSPSDNLVTYYDYHKQQVRRRLVIEGIDHNGRPYLDACDRWDSPNKYSEMERLAVAYLSNHKYIQWNL